MNNAALGFVRVATVVPELRLAGVEFNVREIVAALRAGAQDGCHVALFPELCITGYSCGDLFYQRTLLDATLDGLARVAAATLDHNIVAVVGLPLMADGRLFNCAAVVANGRVHGIVPKTYLPDRGEFYEERWFSSSRESVRDEVSLHGALVPFGADLLFRVPSLADLTFGVEICEDLWAVQPPSGAMALSGATLILNPSASNELLGKSDYRRELVRHQSARCLAAYAYASSGPGESSTDNVYSGHAMIAENGAMLGEGDRFRFETHITVADIDVQRLVHERLKSAVFSSGSPGLIFRAIEVPVALHEISSLQLRRPVARHPFVPADPARRDEHCREIFSIQATGLARRLRHVGTERTVIGVSGGLDSALALLVATKAFDILELDPAGITCVVMPGFGTTERTNANAIGVVRAVGGTLREIPIGDAVSQHFRDIGHDPAVHDVTFENAQARERTQVLMDLANDLGGIVVGTGDLSELALGWATFNGDHMSMYHVNAGVPKTLVRHMIEWYADSEASGAAGNILRDVLATPISPELLPRSEAKEMTQHTEELIGPYALHDFFLYYAIRHGFPPRKVFLLAQRAFESDYAPAVILRWMRVFYTRFFSQQFKRSAMPDGPKVGTVGLSPRGDWRMPSDASIAHWISEIEALLAELQEAAKSGTTERSAIRGDLSEAGV